jgi:outer membrane protein TolC
VLLAIAMCAAAGCAHNPPGAYGSPGVSSSVDTPWKAPARAVEKQQSVAQAGPAEQGEAASLVPPELLGNIQNLTLADIVNIALRNSTQTREAWARALAAAAAYGSLRGSYLPQIDVAASVNWEKNPTAGGQLASGERTYTVGGSISWLLFDFGGREASLEATREAMFAASWTHNSAIQGVILQVEQAYYDYFAAKALLEAQQATVNEAQANLNAADDRHSAGLATIADVLQARTALSSAMLALETLQGQNMTTRGILATAMGLPANTSFDVELPIGAPPVEQTGQSIEGYLDKAMKERPDLAAARAQALEARAHTRSVAAQGYPSISASGSASRLYQQDISTPSDSYNLTIGLNFPLFTGFSHGYDVRQAKALADAAEANARSVRDLVTLQVWTSYYNLQTADQKVRTSDDLLASATQNQEVATGRYKAGVGSILDLLTAQSELESARAQQIQARADWWLAVAQLAHDTGTLEATGLTGRPSDSGAGKESDSKEGKP